MTIWKTDYKRTAESRKQVLKSAAKELEKYADKIGTSVIAKLDDDGILLCPNCQSVNTHHTQTEVKNRHTEDKEGLSVCISGFDLSVAKLDADEFTGRRDEVKIVFWCEMCIANWCLFVTQHKGSTYLSCVFEEPKMNFHFIPIVQRSKRQKIDINDFVSDASDPIKHQAE